MNKDDQNQAAQCWFEEYTARVEKGVEQPRRTGNRYICPRCGYPTLSVRGDYEICDLCDWEDDGQDDPHADEFWGGPNGKYTLAEARGNFKHHLSMYSPSEDAERSKRYKPNPARAEAKRNLMYAFNNISSQETWTEDQEQHILQLEQALRKTHDQLPLP